MTGSAYLTDNSCRSVISSVITGSVSLSNVIATKRFSVEKSTGDVEFNGCDTDEIYVKTNTRNVTGNFLSNKVFITDTSSVDVPKTVIDGSNTHTGDIKIIID